jgi:hypothetical protein
MDTELNFVTKPGSKSILPFPLLEKFLKNDDNLSIQVSITTAIQLRLIIFDQFEVLFR